MFQQATDGGPGEAVVTVKWSGGLGPWLYMFPVQPGSLPVHVTGRQGVLFPRYTRRAGEQDHILSISGLSIGGSVSYFISQGCTNHTWGCESKQDIGFICQEDSLTEK